jgi:SAM-dependent methyltransferase
MKRSKARSATRSRSGRFGRCSIWAPAPAASWKCSARPGAGLGIDLSLDMLLLARARIERAGLRHCSVRQGDIYDLAVPAGSFDVVIIHQVLHFLDDGARAIREAARVLNPGGRLLVVDFAPHDLEFLREEHAHRRLGFAAESVTQWMTAAGLDVTMHRSLRPSPARTARSRCRCGSRAIRACASPTTYARWRDGAADPRFVRSSFRRRPRRWRKISGMRWDGSRRFRRVSSR